MSNSDLINELISKEFEQQYFEECKHIWQNYVPLKGKSNCLQGELLREIEKIRCEAQDNGNINWDKEFTHFCEFITQNLVNQPIFSENEKNIPPAALTLRILLFLVRIIYAFCGNLKLLLFLVGQTFSHKLQLIHFSFSIEG